MHDSIGAQLGALKDKIHALPTPSTQEPISQAPEGFDQQPRPTRTAPRKRMREETGFGNLGPDVVTIQHGTTKASMHMSADERKRMAESVIQQHKVANASNWADVASRFGMAALSVVGAVATVWALAKGVKAGTRGD